MTGPRQSGKTTLCRYAFPALPHISLEPLDVRDYARTDPRGFLTEHRDGVVLDEIQRAPALLSYLQAEVDEDPRPGRFVLTGSQLFGLSEAHGRSLAGRVGLLHLLPPSLDQLMRFDEQAADLWTVLWTGAYPRIHDQRLEASKWLADYTATYVQRDVRQVLNVTDLEAFTMFLRLVAGRTANELNLSSLGGDAGVSHNTARAWLSVLETSFLTFRIPGWHRNFRKQLIRAPKIHFLDSGLACHLLAIATPDQLRLHPLRGAIFESWVAAEVHKSRAHRALPSPLYHFRDAKGFEVDLVLEDGAEVTAIEAKSGATITSDFFRPLERFGEWVREKLPHAHYRSRLVYGGDMSQERSAADAIPWRRIQDSPW